MLSTIEVNSLQIPGYKIEREIGRGGFASVYQAVQESLHRYVALKIMNPVMASDPSLQQRFRNEARIMARLRHPNIVVVHDIGIHEEYFYFSMDYLSGGTLKEKLQQSLAVQTTISIANKIALALGHAHQLGIVHRDIKPGNVLFDANDEPVLTDFGIAKILGDGGITGTGVMLGSGGYMSPEQIQGRPVDRRTDMYAFGVLLWQMLTGEMPYTGSDAFALALKHANEPIPHLPPHLDDFQPLMDRLLAKTADERYQSTEQIIEELEKLSTARTGAGTSQPEADTRMMPTPAVVKTDISPRTVAEKKKSGFVPGFAAGIVAAGILFAAALIYLISFSEDIKPAPGGGAVVLDREQSETLAKQLSELDSERRVAEQQQTERVANLREQQAQLLKQIDAERQALEKTRAEQQATLAAERQTLERLENELRNLKSAPASSNKNTQEQLAALAEEKNQISAAIENARVQARQQETQNQNAIAAERSALEALKSELAGLRKQIETDQANSRNTLGQLQGDKTLTQRQIDEQAKLRAQLSAQQDQLAREKSEHSQRIADRQSALSELRAQLRELTQEQQAQSQQYARQSDELKNEAAALSARIEALRAQSDASRGDSTQALAREKASLEQLREELQHLLAQSGEKNQDEQALVAQLQAEQERIKTLIQAQESASQKSSFEIKQHIEREQQTLTRLQEQYQTARQSIQSALQTNQRLLDQLESKHDELARQLAGSSNDAVTLNNVRRQIATIASELQSLETARVATPTTPDDQQDATAKHRELVERLVIIADDHIRAGRLTKPVGGNALATCKALQSVAPEQAEACLQNIANRYQQWANEAFAASDLTLAHEQIALGLKVKPDHSGLLRLRALVQVLRKTKAAGNQ